MALTALAATFATSPLAENETEFMRSTTPETATGESTAKDVESPRHGQQRRRIIPRADTWRVGSPQPAAGRVKCRKLKTDPHIGQYDPADQNWINVAEPLRSGLLSTHARLGLVDEQLRHLSSQFHLFRLNISEVNSERSEFEIKMQKLLAGVCSFKPVRSAVRRHLSEFPDDESEAELESADTSLEQSNSCTHLESLSSLVRRPSPANRGKERPTLLDDTVGEEPKDLPSPLATSTSILSSKKVARMKISLSSVLALKGLKENSGRSLPVKSMPEDVCNSSDDETGIAHDGKARLKFLEHKLKELEECSRQAGRDIFSLREQVRKSSTSTAERFVELSFTITDERIRQLGSEAANERLPELLMTFGALKEPTTQQAGGLFRRAANAALTTELQEVREELRADMLELRCELDNRIDELESQQHEKREIWAAAFESIGSETASRSCTGLSERELQDCGKRNHAEVDQGENIAIVVVPPDGNVAESGGTPAYDSWKEIIRRHIVCADSQKGAVSQERISTGGSSTHDIDGEPCHPMSHTALVPNIPDVEHTEPERVTRRTSREGTSNSGKAEALGSEALDVTRRTSREGTSTSGKAEALGSETLERAHTVPLQVPRRTSRRGTSNSVISEATILSAIMEPAFQRVSSGIESRLNVLTDLLTREEESRKQSTKIEADARMQEVETLRCLVRELTATVDARFEKVQEQQASILQTVDRVPDEWSNWGSQLVAKLNDGINDFVESYREERRRYNHNLSVLFPRACAQAADVGLYGVSEARLFAQDVRIDAMEEQLGCWSAEKAEMQARIVALSSYTAPSANSQGRTGRCSSRTESVRRATPVDSRVAVSTSSLTVQQHDESGLPQVVNNGCLLGSQVVPHPRTRPRTASGGQGSPAGMGLIPPSLLKVVNGHLLEKRSHALSGNRKMEPSAPRRIQALLPSLQPSEGDLEVFPRSVSVRRGDVSKDTSPTSADLMWPGVPA